MTCDDAAEGGRSTAASGGGGSGGSITFLAVRQGWVVGGQLGV